MSRPSTEAQYLASLVPPSAAATGFGRRSLLRGALAGAGFLGASGLLAACGSSGSSGSSGGAGGGTEAASGTLTFGSNQSDAVPKQAYADARHGLQRPEHQGHDQHGRPQHLPGEHQHLPAGPARRRLHLVRRLPHAVLRRARASPATSATSGRTSAACPTRSRRRPPATTASSTSCRSTNYPWAIFYRQERLPEQGLPGRRRPSTSSTTLSARRCRRTGSSRSRSATRTAGPRWAPSTSSTCASTATTSTSA